MIERTCHAKGNRKGTAMTPESILGTLVPHEVSLLLPRLELVVSEELDQDPVVVALREGA
jgi:hypothetical protein